MRLLNIKSLTFTTFHDDNRPKYVIASHRWVDGSEITFHDVLRGANTDKSGYGKVVDFARYVDSHIPSVEWLWVDTCCINKESAAELSEAINLMFDWYRNAEVCIAHLADVKVADDMSEFRRSEWFKRGWTLQELLAPRRVIFVTKNWEAIGHKGTSTNDNLETLTRRGLESDIANITGIPEHVLYDYMSGFSLGVAEKLKWMDGRSTTREEDMSYALFGILGVAPGANYGEKQERAKNRLLKAVHHEDEAERFQEIVAWLSPPDPWTNHHSARQLHEAQTGDWLVQSQQYRDWKASSKRHLWMSGKAGCGKTVLCSTIVEDVQAHCKSAVNAGLAVFYFTFSEEQKQRPVDLLRSLVAQLGWKEPALSMLQQAYDKPTRNTLGLDELQRILLACFEAFDDSFLLLDAIDECPEEDDNRNDTMECLTQISQRSKRVKIFATSRELLDIRECMTKLEATVIPIVTTSVDLDIRQYLATQLADNSRLSRLDEQTKTLITDTISAKADGMFRWAFCQLQELKTLKFSRPSYLKAALSALPPTLDETYRRILDRIEGQPRTDALTILRWLAYAKTPLSLDQLVDASIIDLTEDGVVHWDDRPGREDPLIILAGLVTILEEDHQIEVKDPVKIGKRRIRLAHFSVKEYLESERIIQTSVRDFHLDSGGEHWTLSQCCLEYLWQYSSSSQKSSLDEDFNTFPLLQYSSMQWDYHAKLQQNLGFTREDRLLGSDDCLRDWLLVRQPEISLESFDTSEIPPRGPRLYYASLLGLVETVSRFLKAGDIVGFQGGYFGNALQAASRMGNRQIVELLMDAGADPNAQGGYHGTALQAASFYGLEDIVRMLLVAGAYVDAHTSHPYNYCNALQAASHRGHANIVQMLLDAGVEVNAQGGFFGNALQAASARNHEKILHLLLDAGAEVNVTGGYFGNALQAAILDDSTYSVVVVQILLEAGANVNAEGGAHRNALHAASDQGKHEILRILLNAGAKMNVEGQFGTVPGIATTGHETVARVLLLTRVGIDIYNYREFYNRAALRAQGNDNESESSDHQSDESA